MQEPFLVNNFLVGGTGLALQMGHRLSVDLACSRIFHSMQSNYWPIRSLTYFEDAEQTEMPVVFDKKVTWVKVKQRLIQLVRENF